MCCFPGAGEFRIYGTTVFARLVAPGTQVLAYQMECAAACGSTQVAAARGTI